MSIVLTRLQDYVLGNDLDKNEMRAAKLGALNTAIRQSDGPNSIVTDNIKATVANSFGTEVKFPRVDYLNTTIASTTQPLVVVDTPLDSRMQTLVMKDYYFGFKINVAKHHNNYISMQKEYEAKLRAHILELGMVLEGDALAVLELAKTQILADDLGGGYALVGNVVQVPNVQEEYVLGDLNLLQSGNKYYDDLDIVGNLSLQSLANRIGEKGVYNESNKTYQFGNKEFSFSHSIPNAAGQRATGFAIPKSSVGFVQAFSPDCIMGHSAGAYSWGIGMLPDIGINAGLYYYEGAENISSLGGHAVGLTATKVQAYGFHMRVGFLVADVSDPSVNANPVMKFQIASS